MRAGRPDVAGCPDQEIPRHEDHKDHRDHKLLKDHKVLKDRLGRRGLLLRARAPTGLPLSTINSNGTVQCTESSVSEFNVTVPDGNSADEVPNGATYCEFAGTVEGN
jgi:hypothetical protein